MRIPAVIVAMLAAAGCIRPTVSPGELDTAVHLGSDAAILEDPDVWFDTGVPQCSGEIDFTPVRLGYDGRLEGAFPMTVTAVEADRLGLMNQRGDPLEFRWRGPPLPFAVGERVTLEGDYEWQSVRSASATAMTWRTEGQGALDPRLPQFRGAPSLEYQLRCSVPQPADYCCAVPPLSVLDIRATLPGSAPVTIGLVETGTVGEWRITVVRAHHSTGCADRCGVEPYRNVTLTLVTSRASTSPSDGGGDLDAARADDASPDD